MPKLTLKGDRIAKKVYELSDGETLVLHFKYLTFLDKTDLAGMLIAKDSMKNAFRCITGWEGVVDEMGKPLPFSIEALDLLLTQYEQDADKILEDVLEFCDMKDVVNEGKSEVPSKT